jgi:hypothetical protein
MQVQFTAQISVSPSDQSRDSGRIVCLTLFGNRSQHLMSVNRSLRFLCCVALTAHQTTGRRLMTECFDSLDGDIVYSTTFPSLVSSHPELCATLDPDSGIWWWHHSLETAVTHRKGGSFRVPTLMSWTIAALDPIINCYNYEGHKSMPESSVKCVVHLKGNSVASVDQIENVVLVVFFSICCFVVVMTAYGRIRNRHEQEERENRDAAASLKRQRMSFARLRYGS